MVKKNRLFLHRGSRNPKPERVQDPVFAEYSFFDPEDLVQVKYEMLRRAQVDGESVSATAARYGFSRPAFYEAHRRFEEHGLPGLLPKRPGPRGGHKLSEKVVDFVEEILEEEPETSTEELVRRIEERFELRVHPRSVQRALARRRKKTPPAPRTRARTDAEARPDLAEAYERLRQQALAGDGTCSGGFGILVAQGMEAWITLCSQLLPDPLPAPVGSINPPPRPAGSAERELVVLMTQMILSTGKELAL